MATNQKSQSFPFETCLPFWLLTPALEYVTDAAQRTALFWDVLRQRGNQYREHLAEVAPHVLDYELTLIADGRTFARPVNYALVRIIPPPDVETNPSRRPFVIVDPRAGHGPGIGGFKADSEVGVVLKAGHPCYFVGFLPDPVPGQTIEDIARAEAIFLEQVIAAHPDADGKPCVIGNCQAGWAIMLLAALRPELFGPIIIAGSPLSYWAGVHGKYPMRYLGGLLGGGWAAEFASDLGCGKFDGAWLVQNFENQNPANTYWAKHYNLYRNIDTEAPRYLGFERWWSGHVNLNADEIQFIVDELFIGNKLAAGAITTSDGTAVDLREIRSPIVVFCSGKDNITPPQQALGWILDLYEDDDQIRSDGQTIVYTIHDTIGHLGIFVSGAVAKKEYRELSSNIELIDSLPPGLYEAKFVSKKEATASSDLSSGDWVMSCEMRTLSDIRALGGNDTDDERRFVTAARISQINRGLYRTFAQPFVRAFMTDAMADWFRQMHPLRMQYEIFSDANPFSVPVAAIAEEVRRSRQQLGSESPFLAIQDSVSSQITSILDSCRSAMETLAERTFFSIYGSGPLQTLVGTDTDVTRTKRKRKANRFDQELLEARARELTSRISKGGLREAVIRGLVYVGMNRASVDERGFELARRIRERYGNMSLADFKQLFREQFCMLLIAERESLAAIPSLMPPDLEARSTAYGIVERILSARGALSADDRKRLNEIAKLFGVGEEESRRVLSTQNAQKEAIAKAS